MPTRSVSFRPGPHELRALEGLADELKCSRSDVLRYGLFALTQDEALRSEIGAANAAHVFIQRLRDAYGDRAQLQIAFEPGTEETTPLISGEPVHDARVQRRDGDDLVHLDLVDLETGVAIRNFYVVDQDEMVDTTHIVPLRLIWWTSPVSPPNTREVRHLPDGSVEVLAVDDDGAAVTVRLSPKLASRTFQAARADWI